MPVTLARHLVAICAALLLIFGLRVQNWDLQKAHLTFDQRWFTDYTPYFPGLNQLEQQEVFSPKFEHTHKIILLGASSVDSIGCDYTWTYPEPGQERNVNYSCSIAGRLTKQMHEQGLKDWHVFDLARNGGKIAGALYAYARIRELHPDIVIFGDSYPYYMQVNADAHVLTPDHYAFLDRTFGQNPQAAPLWASFRQNLAAHGWTPAPPAVPPTEIAMGPQPRPATSAMDLMTRSLAVLRSWRMPDGMLRPVAYNVRAKFEHPNVPPHPYVNPDPGFGYFQAVPIIDAMQREFGGRTMAVFMPQSVGVNDPSTIEGVKREYGGYLASKNIPFKTYQGMRMREVYETHDGNHQTVYGNDRIARALLNDLRAQNLLPKPG